MEKHFADELALIFARDVLRTHSATSMPPVSSLHAVHAKKLAEFVSQLSSEFQKLDPQTNTAVVINAFKNES